MVTMLRQQHVRHVRKILVQQCAWNTRTEMANDTLSLTCHSTSSWRRHRFLDSSFQHTSVRCWSQATPKNRNDNGSVPEMKFENGGSIANLSKSSILGTGGDTVVLSTVATNNLLENNRKDSLFTVDFAQRYAGVGQIPTHTARRRDGLRPTSLEILASRAMDRALRPLLLSQEPQHVHLATSVQAYNKSDNQRQENLLSLGINSASVALCQAKIIKEPVGCVLVGVTREGKTIINPSTPIQDDVMAMELLYAGTKTKTVMMEFCSKPNNTAEEPSNSNNNKKKRRKIEISEGQLVNVMKHAHKAIQPLIQLQHDYLSSQDEEEEPTDEELLQSLGLPPIAAAETSGDGNNSLFTDLEFKQALESCRERLEDAPLRFFGYKSEKNTQVRHKDKDAVSIHPSNIPLLKKSTRGRCEHLILQQIEQLLREQQHLESAVPDVESENETKLSALARAVHKELLQETMYTSASEYKTRGDGRGSLDNRDGTRTIRPIQVKVPALPHVVHGSAFFGRGETKVLCTVTLGAPRDGLPITNPYAMTTPKNEARDLVKSTPKGPYDDLPVGSLRYLRSQTALVSDLNTKKVKADRELTGESGTLDEVQRAFLHYDFAPYSTGEVPGGGSMAANRRAIGHGALAEKAILPSLPPPHDFPYAIRLVCEVTGSNGSSSMASVCGATLALLDAGVDIASPVVGVSVGLAMKKQQPDQEEEAAGSYALLLDITGTEDHYGKMDFKIAGTANGVTALQLDVKQPLSMHVLVEALDFARQGRRAMLDEIQRLAHESSNGVVSNLEPRLTLKDSAPRVEVVRFDPLRKRDLIGPGGAVLRQLEDRFDVSLDLSQEGQCLLYGADRRTVAKARSAVMDLVADIEVGGVYEGTVIEIKDFGAVVELLRNKEGLLHVSELVDKVDSRSKGNYGIVKDHLRVGQKIEVLCTAVDPVQGSIKLSRKKLLAQNSKKVMNRISK